MCHLQNSMLGFKQMCYNINFIVHLDIHIYLKVNSLQFANYEKSLFTLRVIKYITK